MTGVAHHTMTDGAPSDEAAATVRPSPSFGLEKMWRVQGSEGRLHRREILRHHLIGAWSHLRESPAFTATTTVIMGVVLSLCVSGIVLIYNAHILLEYARSSVGLTIFLRDDAAFESREQLERYLRADARIGSVRFESKEEALEKLRLETPAVSSLLQGLETRNPLPSSYAVTVVKEYSSPAIYQELRRRLQQFSDVELVQYNNSLLGELSETLQLIGWLGGGAAFAMSFVAAGIVALTILISVDRRRNEIVVMRLVGAPERFIRGPFVVEGVAKGLLAGGLGIAGAALGFSVLHHILASALPFVPVWDRIAFLPTALLAAVLVVVGTVGGIASFGAVRRAIGPMDA